MDEEQLPPSPDRFSPLPGDQKHNQQQQALAAAATASSSTLQHAHTATAIHSSTIMGSPAAAAAVVGGDRRSLDSTGSTGQQQPGEVAQVNRTYHVRTNTGDRLMERGGGAHGSRDSRDVFSRSETENSQDSVVVGGRTTGGASITTSTHQHPGPVVVKINKNMLFIRWGLLILGFAVVAIWGFVATPYCRAFSWTDESINKTHKEDTFPNWSLIFFNLAPVAVAGILCNFSPIFPGIKWWEFNEMAFCAVLMMTINELGTGPAKIYAGRLRPDFLNRLEIAGYNSTSPDPLTTDYCAISDSLISAGRKSFPSGHSSVSWSTMSLVTLMLMNRFRVFHQPEWRVPYFLASAFPMILAFVVAISRTRDNRHHFGDIVGGSFIGLMSAIVSFRLCFSYCRSRKMFIPSLFTQSTGEELPPVVHEEMPVIA